MKKVKEYRKIVLLLGCSLSLLFGGVGGVLADDTTLTTAEEWQLSTRSLTEIGEKIVETEASIHTMNAEIQVVQEQLSIAEYETKRQYEQMKLRIQYVYEGGETSAIEQLFASKNLAELQNNIDFVQQISEYDNQRFAELQDMLRIVQEQEQALSDKIAAQETLQQQLTQRQQELEKEAEAANADLATVQAQIEARTEAVIYANEYGGDSVAVAQADSSQTTAAQADTSQTAAAQEGTQTTDIVDYTGNYTLPTTPGALNPTVGVVYYNGHRETYYSQRVLPGGGLNIPGRHVASDGTIRDADGYICVASSDYAKGTIVETSLGTGKVYDCGCASGTIDIYTDW